MPWVIWSEQAQGTAQVMAAVVGCESPGVAGEQDQYGQERLDARITKTQGAGTLALDLERLLQFLKGLGPH